MDNKQILENYKNYFVESALAFTKTCCTCEYEGIHTEESLVEYLRKSLKQPGLIKDVCTYTSELMLGCLALLFGEEFNWEIDNIPIDILGVKYRDRVDQTQEFWHLVKECCRYAPSTYPEFIIIIGWRMNLVETCKHSCDTLISQMLDKCHSEEPKEVLSDIESKLRLLKHELDILKSKVFDEQP